MATIEQLQNEHESAISSLLVERAGRGGDSDWALVRALVHRAVHLAADRKPAEFCAVSTLLAEMIGHAHGLMHPGDARSAAHPKDVH